jgi:ComF family protein
MVDVVVPVPLHWTRLLQRGCNQSELLLREVRKMLPAALPMTIDSRLAQRRRRTAPQSSMHALQRAPNLRGAFTVQRPCDNLRIALVDDVLTTGATVASLAHALRAAGAAEVEVWCLARTPAPATSNNPDT